MTKKIMSILTILVLSLNSCADNMDLSQTESGITKSLQGNECAPGCIWSTWAVKANAQKLTHYCDGEGCHCVLEGDIYTSCRDDIKEISYEETYYEETVTDTISNNYNQYNVYKGNLIADEAYYEASSRGTYGWCYNAVADAVERITGPFLWGSHAYQAADQLSSSIDFYEVYDYTLTSLPSGAIVVWGKGSSRSGHISVSLGDGREASDHIAYQMTYHYGGARERVFYPK